MKKILEKYPTFTVCTSFVLLMILFISYGNWSANRTQELQKKEKAAMITYLCSKIDQAEHGPGTIPERLRALQEVSNALGKTHWYSEKARGSQWSGLYKITSADLNQSEDYPWLGEIRKSLRLQMAPTYYERMVNISSKQKISDADIEYAQELRDSIHHCLADLGISEDRGVSYGNTDNLLSSIKKKFSKK